MSLTDADCLFPPSAGGRRELLRRLSNAAAGSMLQLSHPAGWRIRALRRLPEIPRRPWWPELGELTAQDWESGWPQVIAGLEGAWPRFKHDPSGTVAGGMIELGGRLLPVVVKSPRRKRLSQVAADVFRPSRARRSWNKTWALIDAGLPTELPLVVAEQRVAGIMRRQLTVFATVSGEVVYHMSLSALSLEQRSDFFSAMGRVLRATSDRGFKHVDAKTVNWIACKHLDCVIPVMLDADGTRRKHGTGVSRTGVDRFLRGLADHPETTQADREGVIASFGHATT